MNQQEVESWIQQNGGSGRVQYQRSTQQMDNPAADPMTAKAAGVTFDPTAPAKIPVSEEKWVAVDDQGRPTGAELQVRRRPDGDFDVVNQSNPNPTKPPSPQSQQQAEPPKTEDRGGRHYVWQPNPGGPTAGGQWVDAGPAPLTPAERAAQPDLVGKPTGNTRTKTVNGTTTKETEYQLPDGSTVWRSQTETAAPDLVGKPTGNTRTRTEGGQSIKEVEYILPDGSKEWRSQTAVTKGAKMPPGVVPPTSFEYGTAATKLADFWRQLNEAVSRGDITGDEAAALFAPYHQQAEMAVSEQTGILNTQRGIMQQQSGERGQDLTTANARAGVANSIFTSAMNNFTDLNKYVQPGSDAAGRAFLASLKLGKQYVGDMGGLVDVPRTPLLPAVRQAMDARLDGGTPNLGASATAATNAFDQQAVRLGVPQQPPAASPPAPVAAPATTPRIDSGLLLPPPPAEPGQAVVPGAPQAMLPSVQAAMQQAPPETMAGNLLALGFDPDVVDAVHQQRYGRSIFGGQAA